MITITRVEMNNEIAYASVYVLDIGNPKKKERIYLKVNVFMI